MPISFETAARAEQSVNIMRARSALKRLRCLRGTHLQSSEPEGMRAQLAIGAPLERSAAGRRYLQLMRREARVRNYLRAQLHPVVSREVARKVAHG